MCVQQQIYMILSDKRTITDNDEVSMFLHLVVMENYTSLNNCFEF